MKDRSNSLSLGSIRPILSGRWDRRLPEMLRNLKISIILNSSMLSVFSMFRVPQIDVFRRKYEWNILYVIVSHVQMR